MPDSEREKISDTFATEAEARGGGLKNESASWLHAQKERVAARRGSLQGGAPMKIVPIAFLLGIGALLIASWRLRPTAPEDASTPEEKRLLDELAAIQWSALSENRNAWWGPYPDAQQSKRISAIKKRLAELKRVRE
jgi:hypothetical protein